MVVLLFDPVVAHRAQNLLTCGEDLFETSATRRMKAVKDLDLVAPPDSQHHVLKRYLAEDAA